GDQSGSGYDDVVILDLNDDGGVKVTLDGESFSFPPSQVSKVTINSGGGTDTINIFGTASDVPVQVNPGNGNDTITVGNRDRSRIQGAVTVNGQGLVLTDQVIVNAQPHGVGDTYTVTGSTVSRNSFGGLTYSGIVGLTLNTESSADIDINSTASGTPV